MFKPETLSELIGLIYNAALGHGGWEQTLQALSRATSASVGGLIIAGSGGAPGIVVTSGADPASIDSYAHHYHKIDPIITSGPRTEAGGGCYARDGDRTIRLDAN
jgi:hypothetical protein